jgi:two-component sensor histidine kinase
MLDPEAWRGILAKYADTVNLGVALTDTVGRVLGECHNPQPTWRLAHGETPPVDGKCFFCLAPNEPCSAVADALRMGGAVMVQDRIALAHVAVPLSLGGHQLGTLIAGQVFSGYPEPLRIQRAAKLFGVAPQILWHAAILEVPITRTALLVYANLLMTLGESHLGQRYAVILNRTLAETNRKIRDTLREKEVMLREIHHRVKNNMQMVSSLINMQAGRFDDVKDAGIVEAFQSSQQRIAAMARIHDLLYCCEQVGEVELGGYIKDLAEMVISTFQSSAARITSCFALIPVLIDMTQAIPCGLIVNELITNVFKYAYAGHESGDICIDVKPTADSRASFTISDHGVGIPDGLDWKSSGSLGFRIIEVLTRQIGGTSQLDGKGGCSFTVEFPRNN